MLCNNGQSLTLPRLNVMKLLMRALTKTQMDKSQNTYGLPLNCILQRAVKLRWKSIYFFAIKNVLHIFFTFGIKCSSHIEQRTLKNVNKYLNTNICSYLETSGGQSSDL
jgi:hypothetical protein